MIGSVAMATQKSFSASWAAKYPRWTGTPVAFLESEDFLDSSHNSKGLFLGSDLLLRSEMGLGWGEAKGYMDWSGAGERTNVWVLVTF